MSDKTLSDGWCFACETQHEVSDMFETDDGLQCPGCGWDEDDEEHAQETRVATHMRSNCTGETYYEAMQHVLSQQDDNEA